MLCRPDDGMSLDMRLSRMAKIEAMDAKFGFHSHKENVERLGWLINMHPVCCLFCVAIKCHNFIHFIFVL